MRMIATKKSDYIRLVCIYKAKRKALKEKYTFGDPNYAAAVRKINQKIGTYKNAINRISYIYQRLDEINAKVKYRYNRSMYKCTTNWTLQARKSSFLWKMFCKYAIEQGIPDLYVSTYIGWRKKRASYYRMQFSRDMKHNMSYLDSWHSFKKAMERDLKKLKTA